MTTPFFSIIIPVYNREALIGRAIRSCLSQSSDDFEVIVVDDASTDATVARVREFSDARVRLILHERNRGRCPARNTGMAAARGEWFVFLDSDDELLPDALAAIRRRADSVGPDVLSMRFMCVDETGTSPDPPHDDRIWTYEDYLHWIGTMLGRKQETLPCARVSTFPEIQYADSHASEGAYHLALAARGRIGAWSDVVRRYHHDAGVRVTSPDFRRSLRYAPDELADVEHVEAAHGEAMERLAADCHYFLLLNGQTAAFLAGRRGPGLRFSMKALRSRPLSPRIWLVLLAGVIDRRLLALLQWAKWRLASGPGRSA